MDEKELSFVTTVELDTDGVQLMFGKAVPVWSHKRICVLASFYSICLILCIVCDYLLGNWEHVMMLTAIGIVYVLGMLFLTSVTKKKRKQAFLEQFPDGKLIYENGFADDGVHVHNVSNGAHSVMAYAVLKKVVAAGDIWVLVSKSNVCTPIHAAKLSESDRESLLNLLKQNNPKLKIQLPKKR